MLLGKLEEDTISTTCANGASSARLRLRIWGRRRVRILGGQMYFFLGGVKG